MLPARTMLVLAPAVLVVGALSLVYASARLYARAFDAGLAAEHLAWMVPLAALAGWGKARFVMRKRMRANARRFREARGRHWPWQVYPPQLLAFIASMVLMMYVLKRVFAASALGLGMLGGVDLAVAVALVVASFDYRAAREPAGAASTSGAAN